MGNNIKFENILIFLYNIYRLLPLLTGSGHASVAVYVVCRVHAVGLAAGALYMRLSVAVAAALLPVT